MVLEGEWRTDVPLVVLQRIGKAVRIRHGLATVTGRQGDLSTGCARADPELGVPSTDPDDGLGRSRVDSAGSQETCLEPLGL